MADIDQSRRDYIAAKFPAINGGPMNPAMNTTVQATDRGEQITDRTWAIWGDNSVLWDPVWSPEMHARAEAVMGELRAAIAAGELTPDTNDEDYGDAEHAVMLVSVVGSGHITASRQRWRDHPNRRQHPADYWAGMYQLLVGTHNDFWSAGCNVNIAEDCGGSTVLMPCLRGQFLLIFECCGHCHRKARETAETNFRFSVMAVQADLPPGAHIDPGSPVPPTV